MAKIMICTKKSNISTKDKTLVPKNSPLANLK